MHPGRMEAFSDGVIAFAITLLVLDIRLPDDSGTDLAQALFDQWPAFVAYLTSFATIGIMWVNHHLIFTAVARIDRTLLFLNLLLLFGIASVPFTTSLAARFLLADSGAELAMAMYAGWMAGVAATFTLLLRHLGRSRDLLHPDVTAAQNREARLRSAAGVAVYLAAAAVALVSPVAALTFCLAMAAFYFLASRRVPVPRTDR